MAALMKRSIKTWVFAWFIDNRFVPVLCLSVVCIINAWISHEGLFALVPVSRSLCIFPILGVSRETQCPSQTWGEVAWPQVLGLPSETARAVLLPPSPHITDTRLLCFRGRKLPRKVVREGGARQEGEDGALQPGAPVSILPGEVGRRQAAAAGLAFAWITFHIQESQPACSITQKVSVPTTALTPWQDAALCWPCMWIEPACYNKADICLASSLVNCKNELSQTCTACRRDKAIGFFL